MSRSRPTVSCILPAYNYGRYLGKAIDSVLAQAYPADRLEVVVVDDGSTDDTPDVIAAYGDAVHGIRRPNGGLIAATQTGIEAATGELLTFLDADDTWPRDRVHLLARALEARPAAGLAWGDMTIVDGNEAVVAPSFRRAAGLAPLGGRLFGRLLLNNFISAGSMMVRATLREHYCPIRPDAPYQDWWIALQVSRVAEIVAIPESVNRYRQHGGNMNLGSDEAGRDRLAASELPFRRWLLQTSDGLSRPADQAVALKTLDSFVARVAARTGRSAQAVLALGEADRAAAIAEMEAASAELDAGRLEPAFSRLVAACGHDPLYEEPRQLLGLLAPHVLAGAGALAPA